MLFQNSKISSRFKSLLTVEEAEQSLAWSVRSGRGTRERFKWSFHDRAQPQFTCFEAEHDAEPHMLQRVAPPNLGSLKYLTYIQASDLRELRIELNA